MKEFKKWLKEDSVKSGYLYDEHDEKQREKGWKAALEWVLSRTNYHYGDELSNADLILDIEDELKND